MLTIALRLRRQPNVLAIAFNPMARTLCFQSRTFTKIRSKEARSESPSPLCAFSPAIKLQAAEFRIATCRLQASLHQ